MKVVYTITYVESRAGGEAPKPVTMIVSEEEFLLVFEKMTDYSPLNNKYGMTATQLTFEQLARVKKDEDRKYFLEKKAFNLSPADGKAAMRIVLEHRTFKNVDNALDKDI